MNNLLKNKKLWLGVGIVSILVIIFILIIRLKTTESDKSNSINETNRQQQTFILELLNDEEKKQFGLPADARAQVLGREESGAVSVYKIIRSETDLINMSKEIIPISPRQQLGEENLSEKNKN